MKMTVFYLLDQFLTATARRFPNKIAVVSGERRLSYGKLDNLTDKLAKVLTANGDVKGERIGIYVPTPCCGERGSCALRRASGGHTSILTRSVQRTRTLSNVSSGDIGTDRGPGERAEP